MNIRQFEKTGEKRGKRITNNALVAIILEIPLWKTADSIYLSAHDDLLLDDSAF